MATDFYRNHQLVERIISYWDAARGYGEDGTMRSNYQILARWLDELCENYEEPVFHYTLNVLWKLRYKSGSEGQEVKFSSYDDMQKGHRQLTNNLHRLGLIINDLRDSYNKFGVTLVYQTIVMDK